MWLTNGSCRKQSILDKPRRSQRNRVQSSVMLDLGTFIKFIKRIERYGNLTHYSPARPCLSIIINYDFLRQVSGTR